MDRLVTCLFTLPILVLGLVAEAVAEQTPLNAAHFGRQSIAAPSQGPSVVSEAATPRVTNCPPLNTSTIYRFIDGIDPCPLPMERSTLSMLADPFARQVLKTGSNSPPSSPNSIEQLRDILEANPDLAQVRSFMVGEGSQIPNTIANRDASRNLRYVLSWGAEPSVFLSAVPSGTHPGKPAPFLQVIGYDSNRNLFNFYQLLGNDDAPEIRTWMWSGDSTTAHDPRLSGGACQLCHINGALNMKELASPWNNWQSPKASIRGDNIPVGVANDPLFQQLSGADALQTVFQGLQTKYTNGLVAASIKNDKIVGVPALLRRLITNSTVSFAAVPPEEISNGYMTVPPDFFMWTALSSPSLGLSTLPDLAVPVRQHTDFIKTHGYALQQTDGKELFYQQAGTTFFPFFVPVPAYEDQLAIQLMLDQGVIDPPFAAAVLMVDFSNPVFSAQRHSLMKYASMIDTADVIVSGSNNTNGVPAQFAALVAESAKSQPACNITELSNCTPEQQFLYFHTNDWKKKANDAISAYGKAVSTRIATANGIDDYLTLSASRQAQFTQAPVISNLNEFSLFLPCNDLRFAACLRMNTDGTVSADLDWKQPCPANACLSEK
jgi:hypothetical protein